MTQDDIDNGRLVALVGVAPVRPAEFVILRIGQPTAGRPTSPRLIRASTPVRGSVRELVGGVGLLPAVGYPSPASLRPRSIARTASMVSASAGSLSSR